MNAVGGLNIEMRGNVWYGMYFRTCSGNWFTGVASQSNLFADNMTGGCGMLLNDSSNVNGSTVTSNWCNKGGGYAGFRTANSNNSTYLGNATSNNCGRGYLSGVSNRSGAAINRVFATDCSSHGVWLQSTRNSEAIAAARHAFQLAEAARIADLSEAFRE